jgi:hypothetical protein
MKAALVAAELRAKVAEQERDKALAPLGNIVHESVPVSDDEVRSHCQCFCFANFPPHCKHHNASTLEAFMWSPGTGLSKLLPKEFGATGFDSFSSSISRVTRMTVFEVILLVHGYRGHWYCSLLYTLKL